MILHLFKAFNERYLLNTKGRRLWGTLRKEGAPRLLYLKLKIVVLKRCSLLAMPFLLCCVPVLLNALGTLLPFLRD